MSAVEHHDHGHSRTGAAPATPGKGRDPVCGMTVDAATAKHRTTHGDQTVYFCSAGCQAKFAADPARYLGPQPETPKPEARPGVIYTCPMHPQIRQDHPGNCPICGMTLEPVGAAEESGPSRELLDMTRRFWIGVALAAPLVALEMGSHVPGVELHRYLAPQLSVWIQFALASPVVLWCGWPLLTRGWASFRSWNLNMF